MSAKTKSKKKVRDWGSKEKKVKVTYRIKEATANKIRAIATFEGRSQGDVVEEYMSKLVNVKCGVNKNIRPIPVRKQK